MDKISRNGENDYAGVSAIKDSKELKDSVMERVYSSQILALVQNMHNILKLHGVESMITNQYLSAAVGEIPPIEAWPQLWVADEDLDLAKWIVEEAGKDHPEFHEIRICPKCGEEVDGHFAECWHCGTRID